MTQDEEGMVDPTEPVEPNEPQEPAEPTEPQEPQEDYRGKLNATNNFLKNGQTQNLNYLSRNVDVCGRQFVFKTNLEIRARRDERIVNIERT